jgi:hypothetical protein
MSQENERVELGMKIMKYRQIARSAVSDPETTERLIAELEQKPREIDE